MEERQLGFMSKLIVIEERKSKFKTTTISWAELLKWLTCFVLLASNAQFGSGMWKTTHVDISLCV